MTTAPQRLPGPGAHSRHRLRTVLRPRHPRCGGGQADRRVGRRQGHAVQAVPQQGRRGRRIPAPDGRQLAAPAPLSGTRGRGRPARAALRPLRRTGERGTKRAHWAARSSTRWRSTNPAAPHTPSPPNTSAPSATGCATWPPRPAQRIPTHSRSSSRSSSTAHWRRPASKTPTPPPRPPSRPHEP